MSRLLSLSSLDGFSTRPPDRAPPERLVRVDEPAPARVAVMRPAVLLLPVEHRGQHRREHQLAEHAHAKHHHDDHLEHVAQEGSRPLAVQSKGTATCIETLRDGNVDSDSVSAGANRGRRPQLLRETRTRPCYANGVGTGRSVCTYERLSGSTTGSGCIDDLRRADVASLRLRQRGAATSNQLPLLGDVVLAVSDHDFSTLLESTSRRSNPSHGNGLKSLLTTRADP
jgi:hypothetical protein